MSNDEDFKKACDKNLIDQQVECASASVQLLKAHVKRAPTLAELEQCTKALARLIRLKYLDGEDRIRDVMQQLECDIDDLKTKYKNT